MKAFIQYLVDMLSHEFQIPILKKSIVCSPFGIIKNLLIQTKGKIGEEIKYFIIGLIFV